MKTNDIMISSNNSDNGNSGNTASGLEMFVERFAPCHVCGEPSSGWHCGAITCEACKVEFKLMLIYYYYETKFCYDFLLLNDFITN